VGPFPRTGGEGIAANPEVVEAAFSDLVLLQASVSDPINLDESRLVMIRLKEHLPVALKPIEEVREEIIATLADNLARDTAKAKANELLSALQNGDTGLEALAGEADLVYGRHEDVKRSSIEPDAALVKEVFRLPKPADGAAVEAVLPSSNGFAIVQLDSVVQGELEDGPALALQQYERVIANGNASLETAALMRQLRASADVEVFEDQIR
jgi:peptidyl-prolyl cis-trans isomerase D